MVGKKITELKKAIRSKSKKIAFEVKNLDKLKDHEFGISLTNINLQVNYGEILGVAGIAGNGQVELMEILSGEINCEDNDQILLDKTPIGKTNDAGEVILFVDPNQLSFVTVNLSVQTKGNL